MGAGVLQRTIDHAALQEMIRATSSRALFQRSAQSLLEIRMVLLNQCCRRGKIVGRTPPPPTDDPTNDQAR